MVSLFQRLVHFFRDKREVVHCNFTNWTHAVALLPLQAFHRRHGFA